MTPSSDALNQAIRAKLHAHQPFESVMREAKTYAVIVLLKRTRGNQCKAAYLAGVHRNTFSRWLVELHIPPGTGRKHTAVSVWAQERKVVNG